MARFWHRECLLFLQYDDDDDDVDGDADDDGDGAYDDQHWLALGIVGRKKA